MLSKEKTTQHQEKDPLPSLSLSSFQTRRLIYYSTFKRFRFTSSLLLYQHQPSSPQLAQRAKDLQRPNHPAFLSLSLSLSSQKRRVEVALE